MAEHSHIYDSSDPTTRRRIRDLPDLDLYDEHGHEIRIYQENGRKIARRGGAVDGSNTCGLLVNLKTISSLFAGPDDIEDDDDDLDSHSDADSNSGDRRPP